MNLTEKNILFLGDSITQGVGIIIRQKLRLCVCRSIRCQCKKLWIERNKNRKTNRQIKMRTGRPRLFGTS